MNDEYLNVNMQPGNEVMNARQQPQTQEVIEVVSQSQQSFKTEENDEELECGGLFDSSDGIIMRIAKCLIILPFIPIYILWIILICLLTPFIIIYNKYIHKCIVYLYLTTRICFKVCSQQISICCKKYWILQKKCCLNCYHCLNKLWEKFCNCVEIICEKLCNFLFKTCQLIYDILCWVCNLLWIAFVALKDCSAYLLEKYVNFVLIVFMKSIEIRAFIEVWFSVLTIPISLYVIVPIALFLTNKLIIPLVKKIRKTIKIATLAFYIHILLPFYEIYLINAYKILIYIIVNIILLFIIRYLIKGVILFCRYFYKYVLVNFYQYFIVKFLYKLVIINLFKCFKFLFYKIIYKIILVNLAKGIQWFCEKLYNAMKFSWKGVKFVVKQICKCLKWLIVDVLYKLVLTNIYQYVIRPFFKYLYLFFKYFFIYLYRYCIKPFYQLLQYIFQAFLGCLQKTAILIHKNLLLPFWRLLDGFYIVLKNFFSEFWMCLINIGKKRRRRD